MRSNLRVSAFIVLLGIMIPSQFSSASVIPKPNTECKKLGQSITYKEKKFTCLKKGRKLSWNQGVLIKKPLPEGNSLPSPSPTPSTTQSGQEKNPALQPNPVLVKLNQLIKSQTINSLDNLPTIEWIVSPEVLPNRIEELKKQHELLSKAFPSLYQWSQSAVALVSTNPIWLREKALEAGCGEGFIDSIRRLEADPRAIGAGTTYCRGQLLAFFADRNFTQSNWNQVMGSEFGSVIQANSAKTSEVEKLNQGSWYNSTPGWYAEGGQTIFSAWAKSLADGLWSYDSQAWIREAGDYCAQDDLENNLCSNRIGAVALELGIALFGVNAPMAMYPNLTIEKNHVALFEKSFPMKFADFNAWTVSYFQYLYFGKKLPADLVAALK